MIPRGWVLSVLLSLLPWPAVAAMVHPGIVNNTAEYNLMRQKVSAGDDPWAAAYNAIPASVCSYTPTMPSSMVITHDAPGPAYPIRKDAIHAYAAALRWVIGGSTACRDKAIQILNHMKVLTSITGENQRKLNISWYFPPAIYAAELMKHWPGSTWSSADQASWQSWVQTRLAPFFMGTAVPSTSTGANNNWAAYGQNVRSAWAVYTDNQSLLDTVKSDFRKLVEFYIGKFGKPFVFDGFTWETCRAGDSPNGGLAGGDVAHVAMFFNGVTAAAEIEAKQGDASLFSFLGAADNFGLRDGLKGHSPFFFWPGRAGSSDDTWPCNLAINNNPNRPSSRGYNWMAAYNRYRDPIMLTLSNYQKNLPVLGENDFVGLPFDRLTHATSIDSEGPTEPPPPPATPQTWHADDTGTGTACTLAAPCSFTEVVNRHVGGDTIIFGEGTYPECNGCFKSGSASQFTVVKAGAFSPTTIEVGLDKIAVNPGLVTFSASTAIPLWIRPGQHHIRFEGINVTTTGSGTNPALQTSETSQSASNPTTDIVFENCDVQAPTRVGASAGAFVRGANASQRIQFKKCRFHHAGGSVVTFDVTNPVTHGLWVLGPDHLIEDSDVYANQADGLFADTTSTTTSTSNLTVRRNRFIGNGRHGVQISHGNNQHIHNNSLTGNGGAGVLVNATSSRFEVFNNSVHANSQMLSADAYGIFVSNGATGIIRNNILVEHDLGPISIGGTASQVACSKNLTDASTGSSICTDWTFNELAANIWADPSHTTLASRDFRLMIAPTISAAVDNGTPDICTIANANANLCTPVLTLTSFVGAAPDQGAIESGFTAPPGAGQLIGSYSFDTDFQDATTFNNDGSATSVTIDTTNKRAGAGAALFNASTDRITMPGNGASLSSGLTIALSARLVTAGHHSYMFGHTATPPSYSSRVQIKKDITNKVLVGLGSSASSIVTNFTMTPGATPGAFDRFVLRLTPGATIGTGTGEIWANGLLIGSGNYTGLTQFGTGATIGNNDGEQTDGWLGQIDEVRIWNYPLTLSEIAADCATFCVQPTPPDEEFVLGSAEIGGAGDNVVTVQIESGADPARCTPLSDYQVTYGGVAQTETACSITGTTNPILRVTSAVNALPGQIVTLTYQAEDPITVTNNVQGGGSFDPLILTSCTTDITGLSIICATQGNPNPTECQTPVNFVARDECVPETLDSCSMTTGPGARTLTLRRLRPPINGTVAMDLIYIPSDQRISITNLFDPTDPEIPPTTDLAQTQWRCRPDGPDSGTRWKGRPNQLCESPSPGGVNLRLAIANTSAAPIVDFSTSLFCARQDVDENYTDFMRITPDFGTIGLRFGPPTIHGVPDGVLLPSPALPVGGGLTYVAIGGFRRQELQSGRPTLGQNQQMEEEYAIQVGPLPADVPIGTRYVCRAHDRLGNALDSYTGLPGCTSDPAPYGPGDVPCGAPILITSPTRRSQ